MKKIAVLGPKGTFSDVACKKYFENINEELNIIYCPTIVKTANMIEQTKLAILPFENSLDGYVTETLDTITKRDEKIIAEITCPIHFNFVSYEKDIKEINKIFVQYKSKGQCQEFITKNDFRCEITQSNIESLNLLQENKEGYAAIIPSHIETKEFNLVINDIADNLHNETRFLVMSQDYENVKLNNNVKVSCVIYAVHDKPGILYHILSKFEEYNINLTAILSRPTKTDLGKYNFYIEFSLAKLELNKIYALIEKFDALNEFKIKILGVYSNIGDE